MKYPSDFPPEAVARVEGAELIARKELQRITKSTPPHRRRRGADEANFRRYVLQVFQAFAQQACTLGKQGKWRVDRIRPKAIEFLAELWHEAYERFDGRLVIFEPPTERTGSGRNSLSWNRCEREFGNSAEWQRFEKKLLAVAKAQSKPMGFAETRDDLTAQSRVAQQRKADVAAYISEVRQKTGKRISRKDIWTKAGYKSRTEFERWERADPHPARRNKSADETFTRILREKPHLK